jgi:hypothetical protein
MTYWPISSPSVYAATKRSDTGRARISHDGVEHEQGDEKHAGSNRILQAQTETETYTQGKSGVEEKDGAQLSQGNVPNESVEDDIHGEIIAIRVTRSGHMFATLTRTTLTIWQTKASFLACPMGLVLIPYIAYCCTSFCAAFRAVRQNIWPQYRHSPPPRLPDFRRPNHARLLDHLLARDRPLISRLPSTVHEHTWRAFKKDQCDHWLQDTTTA